MAGGANAVAGPTWRFTTGNFVAKEARIPSGILLPCVQDAIRSYIVVIEASSRSVTQSYQPPPPRSAPLEIVAMASTS